MIYFSLTLSQSYSLQGKGIKVFEHSKPVLSNPLYLFAHIFLLELKPTSVRVGVLFVVLFFFVNGIANKYSLYYTDLSHF